MAEDNDFIIEPVAFQRAETRTDGAGFRVRPVPLVIALAFVGLALGVAFMFQARAVSFVLDPLPTGFRITEGWPTWQLGERFLMMPGQYRIAAELEGFSPLSEVVLIGPDADQTFQYTLLRLPGILTIDTEPATTATVYIDQQNTGSTPVTIDAISPGLHDIRLESARYQPYDTEIDIEGMRIEQQLTAQLLPGWAEVTLTSLPEGATILVDDTPLGVTPATVEVMAGTRPLKLQHPGYKTWQTTLAIEALVPMTLPLVALRRSDGQITVTSEPAGATITIDNQYRGQTPMEITLAPGNSYKVRLSRTGYAPIERSLVVEPEQDVVLDARLEPILGVIRLLVQPEGGHLVVDGQSLGEPSRRLELTAKPHDILITKEGYAEYRNTITPQPGLSQQLMIQLQTEAQAKVAAIKAEYTAPADIQFKLVLPDVLHMGASRREPGRRSNEIEKDVRLTRPFYLSIYEVTNEGFKLFQPGHESGILGRSVLTEPNRPVVNISWNDAAGFCNWLSEKEGLPNAYRREGNRFVAVTPMNQGYRLPTEAEWDWSARYAAGPVPTRFPWGNAMPPTMVAANYADESAINMAPYYIAGYNDRYRGPAPVGTFTPNEFGLYDLAGNVSEWIHDFYSIALPDGELVDPLGPNSGDYHVIRGSNYTHGRLSEHRWTYRDYGTDSRPEVGFRIARYVE